MQPPGKPILALQHLSVFVRYLENNQKATFKLDIVEWMIFSAFQQWTTWSRGNTNCQYFKTRYLLPYMLKVSDRWVVGEQLHCKSHCRGGGQPVPRVCPGNPTFFALYLFYCSTCCLFVSRFNLFLWGFLISEVLLHPSPKEGRFLLFSSLESSAKKEFSKVFA